MIDFIDLQKCQCKDTPFFSLCKPFPCRMNEYGWETYSLHGCNEMEVHWSPVHRILRIKGSLPYFLQGHNFSFNRSDYVEGVEVIQDLLHIGLWDAELNAFEYGVIVDVQGKPRNYIISHTAKPKTKLIQNEKGKDKGCFRWWENSFEALKMYDAKKNIEMKQGTRMKEELTAKGYVPESEYLKFEMHCKKPHLLNGGRNMFVEDLQNMDWLKYLNNVLIEQYHLLTPMKELVTPTDKKDYSCLDIVVAVYAEALMNEGITLNEAKKQIYSTINKAACLSKSDKDGRKATIRRAFGRLQEANESQWDLTNKIKEALNAEINEQGQVFLSQMG